MRQIASAPFVVAWSRRFQGVRAIGASIYSIRLAYSSSFSMKVGVDESRAPSERINIYK